VCPTSGLVKGMCGLEKVAEGVSLVFGDLVRILKALFRAGWYQPSFR
jgi:hypothetical protein